MDGLQGSPWEGCEVSLGSPEFGHPRVQFIPYTFLCSCRMSEIAWETACPFLIEKWSLCLRYLAINKRYYDYCIMIQPWGLSNVSSEKKKSWIKHRTYSQGFVPQASKLQSEAHRSRPISCHYKALSERIHTFAFMLGLQLLSGRNSCNKGCSGLWRLKYLSYLQAAREKD